MSGLDRLIAANLIRSPRIPSDPLRAERATMGLIRRSGVVVDDWATLSRGRQPPIRRIVSGSRVCPICGLPRFGQGEWWELAGRNRNGWWHTVCVDTWKTWTSYGDLARYLAARQNWECPETGLPLRVTVERGGQVGHYIEALEVDHRVPLWRVRAEADQHKWPDVLRFWGVSNLQALTPAGHKLKTKREAAERAALRRGG